MMAKRFICFLLACLLVAMTPIISLATETEGPVDVTLSLYSNISHDTQISGLYEDNIFYITLEKLCELVDGTITSQSDNRATIKVGIREFDFDVAGNNMAEKLYLDNYNVTMPALFKEGQIYISALHFLRYVGATVHIDEQASIQFMVIKRYDIFNAIEDLSASESGNFFWWDEVDAEYGEIEDMIVNAGVVALINRDSNVFRMMFDAKGMEREAIEDALLSIVKNEGAGYFDADSKESELIDTESALIGAESDWFGLIKEAFQDTSELGEQISDLADSAVLTAGFANNVVKAVESLKQFDNMSVIQKDLLATTILAHSNDSETLNDQWGVVLDAARNVDTKVQSEYAAQIGAATQVAQSTAYDLLNGAAGAAGANPVAIAWNGAIMLTKFIPFTNEMISRKDKLYNAYNSSMIQLIANEMLVNAYSDWYYSNGMYTNIATQYDMLKTVKQLMILQLKSTLTTREYLIQSGLLDESYANWMKDLNQDIALLLNKTENCKITGVNMYSAEYEDDLSWIANYVSKIKLLQEIRMYRYSELSDPPFFTSVYTFNADGQLISETSGNEYYENNYVYSYDADGRLISKMDSSQKDWHSEEDIERTYSDKGLLIKESSFRIGDNWTTIEYTYSDDGRVSSEHWTSEWGFEANYSHAYTETADGTVIDTRQRTDDVEYKTDAVFKYDATGRMIQGLDEYWDEAIYYTYEDNPYFDIVYTQEQNEYIDMNNAYAVLRDFSGATIEEIDLGNNPSLEYDDDGYLKTAWASYTYTTFVYEGDETLEDEAFELRYGSLDDMPEDFIFSSGAGAWGTVLTINDDWSFYGTYHDSEWNTVYICEFTGRFSKPTLVNEYTYSMTLQELNYDNSGREYDADGIHYITSDPYGLDNADEFLIYLPGAPISELPEEFVMWSFLNSEVRATLPSGFYGLYNVGGQEGFTGRDPDSFWYISEFNYSYNGCRSSLWPRDNHYSHVTFWPGDGAATIDVLFYWTDDEQREFNGYDSKSNEGYHISLDIAPDYSSVEVELISRAGNDLSLWGGTRDGHLLATYTRNVP